MFIVELKQFIVSLHLVLFILFNLNNNIQLIVESLPLAEFWIEEGISEEESRILIESEPPLTQSSYNPFDKLVRL